MIRVYFIYTFIFFTLLASGSQANQCTSFESLFDSPLPTTAHLEDLLKEAFDDPNVYKPLQCYENVRSLYNEYLQPDFQASDFKVLLIFKRSFAKYFPVYNGDRAHIFSPKTHRAAAGMVPEWRCHVVLEYRGKIIDLDSSEPGLISKKDFLNNFSKEDLEDLVVVTVEGKKYLLSTLFPINQKLALEDFKASGKKYGLTNYLDR